jgi:DNA-binding LacI/PurR family transcriptional regulator
VEKEREYFKSLAGKGVDGIICISSLDELTEDVIFSDTPIVCIDRLPQSRRMIPQVSNDDVKAVHSSTEYLINKGCRHILYLSGYTAGYTKKSRLEGYKKALKDNGITLDKNYILEPSGNDSTQVEAELLVSEFLTTERSIDGIVTASDMSALGALYAVKQAGLSVPADVKIIGFDNTFFTCLTSPSISSVERNPKGLAEASCDILLKMINGEDDVPAQTFVPTTIIERQSSL